MSKTEGSAAPSGGDYDFVGERNVKKPTNNIESIAHLIKGCLGGGIMGIHEAYMKCGLLTAVVASLIFGIYIGYCKSLLVESAQVLYQRLRVPTMSYPDVVEAAVSSGPFVKLRKYSKCFRYTLDVIIVLDLFGACCVYEIIIGKTMLQFIDGDPDPTELNPHELPNLRLYIFLLLAPLILLCMITSLKYLAPFSLVADGFIVLCVGATIYYAIKAAGPLLDMPVWKDLVGFFEFSGIATFSMEGIGVCLPIENSMKNPRQFNRVVAVAMSVVILFLITVGFFGYWGFGEDCKSPVTLNFPQELFPNVLKILMTIMIFVTFGLNFWAPFNLVWFYISKKHNPSKHWLWERVYRAIFVAVITGIAIAFPNMGNMMGLIGAFCLSNIGFIFPGIIDILVIWEYPGLGRMKWKLWKNIIVILIGVFMFFAGTYANLLGLIASF